MVVGIAKACACAHKASRFTPYPVFRLDLRQLAASSRLAPLAALATAACRWLVGGTRNGAACAADKSLVVQDVPVEQRKGFRRDGAQ